METDDKKDKKRKDILSAAQEVFSRKGYFQATVEEIAVRAGVAKGTVYLYYPSKAHLLLECLQDIFNELAERMRDMVKMEEKENDTRKILRHAIRVYLDHLNTNKELIRLALNEAPALAREIGGEESRQAIAKMPWRYVKYVEAGLARGMKAGVIREGDPRILALGLLGAAQYITLYHLYNEPDKDLTALLDDIVRVTEGMIVKDKETES